MRTGSRCILSACARQARRDRTRAMKRAVLVLLLFAGCPSTALKGSVSAIAAPVPVMLGPVRCIGTCGPPPKVKHPYGKDLVSEMGRRDDDVSTSKSDNGTTTTTTTTTTTLVTKDAGFSFAYPLMTPLVKLPFSKRTVVQLDALDLGHALDAVGAGTNNQSAVRRLLAIGIGYSHLLAAGAFSSQSPRASSSQVLGATP
jgi:hypothetical protein